MPFFLRQSLGIPEEYRLGMCVECLEWRAQAAKDRNCLSLERLSCGVGCELVRG
jgi:hypothetical protein